MGREASGLSGPVIGGGGGSDVATSATATATAMATATVAATTATTSQAPLLSSTDSSASVRTLKGIVLQTPSAAAPTTPSYPFPRMDIAIKSPLATPDIQRQFVPFTALSPTTEPASVKMVKAKLAQDFKASGHMKLAMGKERDTHMGLLPIGLPDHLRIAIQLQTDSGLRAWWSSLCQVAKENFGAERASLAVPSDVTDIENVPWVQLGTFRGGNEDVFSRMTNERTSDRSNLTEISLHSKARRGGKQDDPVTGVGPAAVTAKNQQQSSTKSAVSLLAQRPKLELRHSYAGYPIQEKVSSQDFTSNQPKTAPRRPRLSRASSSAAVIEQADLVLELNEEALEKHDQAYESVSKGDITGFQRITSHAQILDVVQPLEIDADALIDGSGIFKVMHRGSPVILTRQYREMANITKNDDGIHTRGGVKSQTHTPTRPRPRPGPAARSKSYAIKPALRTLEESPEKGSSRQPVYEDFEQVPQSPWSQSPAPSPAARIETDDNPFFPTSGSIDEGAFDESTPTQSATHQTPLDYIPAIGLDKSSTIIQIPLIHPNTRPTQHLDRRSTRSTVPSTRSPNQEDSIPSATLSKYAPVAILSLLIPVVPYPMHLSHSLTELSPLFAATFVSARQHTSMIRQMESLSRKRRFAPTLSSELSFNTADSDFSRMMDGYSAGHPLEGARGFSPTSTESPTDPSNPPVPPTESTMEKPQQLPTPGFVAVSSKELPDRKPARTPSIAMETGGSYFAQDHGQDRDVSSPAVTPKQTVAVKTLSVKDHSKMRLHSHGANFAATHPALPTATSTRASGLSKSPDRTTVQSDAVDSADTDANLHALSSIKPSVSMLQTMIDNGAAQQWIAAGSDGMILWANAKFLVYRQSKGDDLDNEFWESILPKERQSFRLAWSSALQTGEQFSKSCRLRRFNGQYRWFSVRIIPIKDRHGATKFYHGQAMDIHDQREAERSVNRAKEHRKYRTLANSIPVIVFAAHVPTGVTYANSQWLSYSGQSEDEYKGFGFLDHVHPDDLIKCRFPGFNGNPLPSVDHIGRHPLYRHDSSTSNASSNAESEGTNATQTTAKPVKANVSDEDISKSHIQGDLLRQLADEGVVTCERDGQGNLSISMEMRLKSRTGEYRWHVVSGSYIDSVDFGSGDAPAQWFLTATDITSQKLTESRIADAKLALENANSKLAQEVKSKMSYLSSMSHEIRTPLNGIIGNLQFLINTGLAEEAYDWAHGAKDAATNMSELINDILDLSKAEANMLHLSSHTFSPREIIENVLDQLHSKVTERQLELSVEVDPRVPLQLKGDSGRIRQVLLNLVSNAVKFTPKGEIWISCDLVTAPKFDLPRLNDNERFVQWKIQDTGKGFTEADKAYLFKEYSQIKKRKDKDIGGTGLGLILCRTMVELHGGKIDAHGEAGKGACFEFFARFKIPKQRLKGKSPPMRQADGTISKSQFSSITAAAEPPSPVRAVSVATPASMSSVDSISPATLPTKIGAMTTIRLPTSISVMSPAVSSAGSSIISGTSTSHFARSLRSSSSLSTNENKAALMKLTLPDKDDGITSLTIESPLSAKAIQHLRATSEGITPGIDGVTFRPPMYSILLYCPLSNARRITMDQIQYVVPKSVPCQLKAEGQISYAVNLLSGADAVTFSHVVVRTTSDEEALMFIDTMVNSDQHQHTCLVLITTQSQVRAISEQRPGIDVKAFQKQEKLIILQRPCHTYKLSRIFDPLKENEATIEDPLAAKRKEEKRLQKESYALFRRELGERRLRVLAVEDNKVQMTVLTNFLGKICGLEVKTAWNGRECLDVIQNHPLGYFSAVVSDIEMPIMSGYEMARELRKWERETGRFHVPTVSLSANTVKEGWLASAEAGFTHFTPKPVNFTDLGNVLLEITQPNKPHIFLRDRPLPRELSGKRDVSSDEESDEDDGDGEDL